MARARNNLLIIAKEYCINSALRCSCLCSLLCVKENQWRYSYFLGWRVDKVHTEWAHLSCTNAESSGQCLTKEAGVFWVGPWLHLVLHYWDWAVVALPWFQTGHSQSYLEFVNLQNFDNFLSAPKSCWKAQCNLLCSLWVEFNVVLSGVWRMRSICGIGLLPFLPQCATPQNLFWISPQPQQI